MILVLARNRHDAQTWIRSSGTDPAQCIVVTKGSNLCSSGAWDADSAQGTAPADFYDAEDITEIIEVGVTPWWRTDEHARTCLGYIRQEMPANA